MYHSGRRRGPAAIGAVLALTILPLAALPGTALDVAAADRFSEATPAETAVQISMHLFPSPATATDAVLIREDGADPAEHAGALASSRGGPVLVSGTSDVPDATMAELVRLGVSTVHLMGDATVLDGAVAAELAPRTVVRVPNALAAAEATAGAGTALETVFLVSDASAAEQIVAGPAAATGSTVALEVQPSGLVSLPVGLSTFLSNHAVSRAVMVGEVGEDGQDLADLLQSAGVEAVPLYGRDLHETSVALSETSFREPTGAVLANPSSVSSSLLAAGLAGGEGAPLLYVRASTPLPLFVEGALSANANNLTEMDVVGSTGEVDNNLVDAAVEATDPIEPLPLADVEPGMIGTGHTVVQGIDPVSFDVEVIDVIPDGIAAGLDMILVETSGPVIDDTGGIAAGFSGSPVYVDVGGETRLMGAIAYGCGGCDQRIGGVTPAEAMIEVLGYPNASVTSLGPVATPATAEVRAAGLGALELRRLDLPTAIGGLTQRRVNRVAEDLERAGYDLTPFVAGNAGGPVFQPFDPLFPGHSWAGVLASGSFGLAGIGTTTYRDGDESLAFGHPFLFDGRSVSGISSARVHHVFEDPSHVFGGFKVASVTAAHGILRQDRLAAVSGTEGTFPHMADLDFDLANLNTGKDFSFRTDAAVGTFFPDLAAMALLGGLDRAFDEFGGGTVLLEWTLHGRDGADAPFSVTRTNRYVSDFDVTFESIFELLDDLFLIQTNGTDEVSFEALEVTATLTDQVQVRNLTRVRARSSSFPAWRTRRLLAEPGDRITVQSFLQRPRGDTTMVQSIVRAPRRMGRAALVVKGGGAGFFDDFFFEPGGSPSVPSLDKVLAEIEGRDRSDELIVEIRRGGQAKAKIRSVTLMEDVISGMKRLGLRVVRR